MRIANTRIDEIGFEAAVERAAEYLRGDTARVIITADASTVVIAQSDNEMQGIVHSADMVTPDSTGILWAAKRLGIPIRERVSGVDLTWRLCEFCAKEGHSVFLLGAEAGVAERAAANLANRIPSLQIAGTHHGFFEHDDEVVEAVNASGARLLFVAMGIPRQEKWISRNLHRLNIRLAIGVGGTFDVLAGKVQRAPEWMRVRGLEWFYRLARNPRKISKVVKLPKFVWLVYKHGSAIVRSAKE